MFRPLLAPRESPAEMKDFFELLPYPLYVSPKIDGIRSVNINGVCLSRTLTKLPSEQVQNLFGEYVFLDGELVVGPPTDGDIVYNRTYSHVMSRKKPGDVSLYVFDICDEDEANTPFEDRLKIAKDYVSSLDNPRVKFLHHDLIRDYEGLINYENEMLAAGYEGIMMRTPKGPYKHNRATYLDGIIYKLKRFVDAEGLLVDFNQGETNVNELEVDERGYAKRSTKKEGKIKSDMVGSLILKYNNTYVEIAPGSLTHNQRKDIIKNPDKYLNKAIVTFRFFGYGIKNKLRFPRAKGFRNKGDL